MGEATLLKIWISCFAPLLTLDFCSFGLFLLTLTHNYLFLSVHLIFAIPILFITKYKMNYPRKEVGLWDYCCQFIYHLLIMFIIILSVLEYFQYLLLLWEIKFLLIAITSISINIYIFIVVYRIDICIFLHSYATSNRCGR